MILKDRKKPAKFKYPLAPGTDDRAEVERFNRLADEWWKADGAFKVVHAFNAARIGKLSDSFKSILGRSDRLENALSGLTLLDVGCGAGIVSEPMANLGAKVTAIDASERNILVAKKHAEISRIQIDYQNALPEELSERGDTFDIVMSLEVIEHVANPDEFLRLLTSLVKPSGILAIGTINRTATSFIKAIIGAEHVMRWLPKGTHHWRKFVRPEELDQIVLCSNFAMAMTCGVDFNPFRQQWCTTTNLNSIYLRVYKRCDAKPELRPHLR